MMSGYQRIRGLSPVARGGIRCVAVGWEMRWGQWKAVFGHKIDSVLSLRYDIRLSLGLWLALAFSFPFSDYTKKFPGTCVEHLNSVIGLITNKDIIIENSKKPRIVKLSIPFTVSVSYHSYY